ncbi:steroid receptor RNA activator 1 [Musca domestica]|uniref:Steroid receptor RNA activator 1 n=1 Tax=Musca domestica TaxID=7370 RepID=A0A9J7I6K2_MUSDO|nr:steroid receptor RNA activator 1 [Musca domestica]
MADKPPTAMPPASEPFPGSRTPGWNDPPPLPYNPMSAAAPGRPRISLNKRVAYPLQGSVTSTTATTKPTAVVLPNQLAGGMPLPPPPMAVNAATTASIMQPVAVVHPMPPMIQQQQHSSSQQETIVLPTDALAVSFRNLRERVPLVQESVNVRREEIERRLGIIEQLWQTGNLSEAVKQKIYKLSLAVERGAHNEAMEIYTSLVANHANECTSWAITLRHIVLTIAPTPTPMAATSTVPSAEPINVVAPNNSSNTNISNPTNLVSAIPTMSVTAMPRPTNSNEGVEGNTTAPISRIQHI